MRIWPLSPNRKPSGPQYRQMSEGIVISVANVSKAYRIWESPASRLISPLQVGFAGMLPAKSGAARWLENRSATAYRDFYALSDISFNVKKGESVGIIGRNGSGKSTLLQIIAGTLQPTAGSIQVKGRVAALLELGAGFNPDFTGRENVLLSAAVLGLSREEVDARFGDITAFADIGDFIDQPVKTYSSGMMMRLAFAVNTCVDPDILIVDEALSVGDAPFQAKCFRRLRQLIDKGVSLLFVSHDVGTVRSICTRALWLKEGRVEMVDEAKEVAKMYERFCWQEQGVVMEADATVDVAVIAATPATASISVERPSLTIPRILLQANPAFVERRMHSRIGTGAVVIENFVITKTDGTPANSCEYNESLEFLYLGKACSKVDSEFVLSVRIRDLKGNQVLSAHDIYATHRLTAEKGDQFVARFSLNLPLHHQEYAILTGIFGFQGGESRLAGSYDFGLADVWDVIEDAAFLRVNPCPVMPLPGPVHVSAPLHFELLSTIDPK
jgi:lipopolysaccharide transport system ATP-binding protein